MGQVTIGIGTYGNFIRRGTANNITIGNYCSIADGVLLDGGFSHKMDFVSTFPFHTLRPELPSNITLKGSGDIHIRSDVWIGEGAVIMSGVTIGHGAVIGLRAIVSKDVNPYEIIVGAPQKVLRKRFSDEQIEELLKIRWWDKSESWVLENAHLLVGSVETFIERFKI